MLPIRRGRSAVVRAPVRCDRVTFPSRGKRRAQIRRCPTHRRGRIIGKRDGIVNDKGFGDGGAFIARCVAGDGGDTPSAPRSHCGNRGGPAIGDSSQFVCAIIQIRAHPPWKQCRIHRHIELDRFAGGKNRTAHDRHSDGRVIGGKSAIEIGHTLIHQPASSCFIARKIRIRVDLARQAIGYRRLGRQPTAALR